MSAPQVSSSVAITANTSKKEYTLYYRTGNNPYPQTVNFLHPASASFQAVVQRAQRHCEIMNYRFVSVKPAIVDFDELEKMREGE